jgi:hypothetical protein
MTAHHPAWVSASVENPVDQPGRHEISETWQCLVLGAAALALLVFKRGVVETPLTAGVLGAVLAIAGAPIP